jgi:uroporphyrinogen-III synthase
VPKVAAVGSRTEERLRSHGIDVTVVPAEFRAEALVDALTVRTPLSGARVLLPQSEIGRDTIAEGLRAAGAIVTDVVAYRTIAETPDPATPDVRGLLMRGEIDAVTFTSGSAVRHFTQAYGPEAAELLRDTSVAVIGPVTGDAARELGIPVHVQPATYTTAAMVTALAEYLGHHHD